MQILNTQRLLLRTMNEEDFDILYENIFSNINVVRNTFGSSMFSKEQTIDFLNDNGNFTDKVGLSVLIEKETNSVIGLAGSLKCEYLNEEDYEIGFILQESSWGKGYAKEIGLAQIEQIKNELNKNRAIAVAALDNVGSIKSLESLGFEFAGQTDTSRGKRNIYIIDF